jgi:hypothetical protein
MIREQDRNFGADHIVAGARRFGFINSIARMIHLPPHRHWQHQPLGGKSWCISDFKWWFLFFTFYAMFPTI